MHFIAILLTSVYDQILFVFVCCEYSKNQVDFFYFYIYNMYTRYMYVNYDS